MVSYYNDPILVLLPFSQSVSKRKLLKWLGKYYLFLYLMGFACWGENKLQFDALCGFINFFLKPQFQKFSITIQSELFFFPCVVSTYCGHDLSTWSSVTYSRISGIMLRYLWCFLGWFGSVYNCLEKNITPRHHNNSCKSENISLSYSYCASEWEIVLMRELRKYMAWTLPVILCRMWMGVIVMFGGWATTQMMSEAWMMTQTWTL